MKTKKTDRRYTYAEYRQWPREERWELIHGEAWSMSPAPSRRHQAAAGEIFRQLANWLTDKPCSVFVAPFDVLLPDSASRDDEQVDSVVQPGRVLTGCGCTVQPAGRVTTLDAYGAGAFAVPRCREGVAEAARPEPGGA